MPTQPQRGLPGLLLLTGLFVAALVVCNLVANKFVRLDLGFHEFTLSAGALPYPLTFLITDLLSEFYGKKRANQVVRIGFVASIMVLGILALASQFPAIQESPAGTAAFNEVFGTAPRVIFASMTAYIVAQLLDIQLFHFWKRLTKGKHLWLRNNGSTIVSQMVDSTLVVVVLFYDRWTTGEIVSTILDLWFFKVLCALLDTPIIYLIVGFTRDRFPVHQEEPS
ncbi:MAG: queuosine precursor transporter [Planctomycetota bacterium]|jgi:uncharacterized integral membrane protein (TIGR00697 family)